MDFYKFIKSDLEEVDKEIERIIPDKPEEVYSMLLPFIKKGGKRLRPALGILTCLALDGDKTRIIKPMALIELFHNFTLIHDDIEDSSKLRRGEPTLHETFGIPLALNSGDALYTILWQSLINLDIPHLIKKSLCESYVETFRKVVEGQGTELSWYCKKKFDITENDYVKMIHGKTASLLGLAGQTGALIAGASDEKQKEMRLAAENLGLAFQIQDDILNIVGSEEKYQKEICGDITEGKRTLMVVKVMELGKESERKNIVRILGANTKKRNELEYVKNLFIKYRAMDYARKKAEYFLNRAYYHFNKLGDSEAKKMIFSLTEYVVNREK